MHIKDHFSKFSQLYPLQTKFSAEVAMRMSEWIGAFGVPIIVQADNGREFKGLLELKGWAVGLPACALAINRTMQRAIKVTPYQMVFRKEMKRYEILPVAMREGAQVEEEAIEEDTFDISDAEE
ncbi:MAG: hypothetical protein M1840_000001 [Geoglossum simile]|nr:MAG: hypothetical protein M1840_000001 [Geoglossum simile]